MNGRRILLPGGGPAPTAEAVRQALAPQLHYPRLERVHGQPLPGNGIRLQWFVALSKLQGKLLQLDVNLTAPLSETARLLHELADALAGIEAAACTCTPETPAETCPIHGQDSPSATPAPSPDA